MRKIYYLLIIILLKYSCYANKKDLFRERMDNYTKKVKLQWEFNPLKNYETDRYFSGWLDPDSYSSRFYLGEIFNIKELYPNKNFNFDKMSFYYQPTLATEVTPISFIYKNIHRFKIGIGYLVHFFLSRYNSGYDQYYGQSLFYGTYMQVEVFFDYIFNDSFKFRISPLKHICSHINGDILGDTNLYNSEEEFRDSGFEQMQLSIYYKYGWFTFYGGLNFAISGFKKSNFINLFNVFTGIDLRVPIWGEISFLSGLYFAGNYDRLNNILRNHNNERYYIVNSEDKYFPALSIGVGFEIYRIIIGVRIEL